MNEETPLTSSNAKMVTTEDLPVYPVQQPSKSHKYLLGISYMFAMGVCGTVLVALGSTLGSLAINCNTTATAIGTVFVARGTGAVLGAILSAKLYLWFQGTHVMVYSLSLITILLVILPFNKSVGLLHLYFLLLGVGTAVTDTGCQIMTRKIHGMNAGPWLGANTVAFGISGAMVPLIELLTTSVFIQYYVVAAIVACVTLMIGMGPKPEQDKIIGGGGAAPGNKQGNKLPSPHYRVEMVISVMVFCFIGGKVTTTAYLSTYVAETAVITTREGSILILVLWLAITVGRLAGVQDQRFLTNQTLPQHLSMFCTGGFLAMLLVFLFPHSSDALWIGVAAYGLFNGPCVGYCYDLNNRITYPSEKSMAIVMFGLNFGASLVPYITSVAWSRGGAQTLVLSTLVSMFVPLPLLFLTKYLSYDPNVNPLMKNGYNSIPQDEVDDDSEPF